MSNLSNRIFDTGFKSLILSLIFSLHFNKSNAQTVFLSTEKYKLIELYEGQFLGANYGAVLRESPDEDSEALDTLFDHYELLYFSVLNSESMNGYVNVKMISSKPGLYDSEKGIMVFPKIIDDGIEGWISYKDINWHPVPESFYLSTYFESEEMLEAIILNAQWQSVNKKKEYEWVRPRHAKCYLVLSIKNYERDSLRRAIYYSTKSIQILPKNTAYKIRIMAKMQLSDFLGVISDCNSGILFSNTKRKYNFSEEEYVSEIFNHFDDYKYLYFRGLANLYSKKLISAISDFDKVIKSQEENYLAFYYRGVAKYNSGNRDEGCLDFSKAGDLGYDKAFEAINEYCGQD